MNLPDFPDDALFQYHTGNREGEWSGFRVFKDGRLHRQKRDAPWHEDVSLDEAPLLLIEADGAVRLPSPMADLARRAAVLLVALALLLAAARRSVGTRPAVDRWRSTSSCTDSVRTKASPAWGSRS